MTAFRLVYSQAGLDCGLLDIYSFQAGFLEMKSRTP